MGTITSVSSFIFITTLLIHFPMPIQTQCCDNPVFGYNDESCGTADCTTCTKGDYIVIKQEYNKGVALGFSRVLQSASRIILEDNSQPADFLKLTTLSYNGSDHQKFPEPLIRIRRSNVSAASFAKLKNIKISPLEPYCQKGTIYDIDYMDPAPLNILKDLEKNVLKPCVKLFPTTSTPVAATCPPQKPCICNQTTQATSRSPPPVAVANSQQKNDAGEGKKDAGECSCQGTIILTVLITSLVWFLLFVIMVLVFRSTRASQPPPEKEICHPPSSSEISKLFQCVEFVSFLVHTCYASLVAAHTVFAEDTSNLFEIIELRTAYISAVRNTKIGSFQSFGESVVARQGRLASGEALYETDVMKQVQYREGNVIIEKYDEIIEPEEEVLRTRFVEKKASNKSSDVDILEMDNKMEEVLRTRFVEKKASNKSSDVDILEMDNKMEEVKLQRSYIDEAFDGIVIEERRKLPVMTKTELPRKTAGEEVLTIDEEARECAGKNSKASGELTLAEKKEQQNLKKKRRPDMVQILDNMVANYRNKTNSSSECDEIGHAWMSLGAIVRLLTEMENAKNMMKANYDETKLQLCRVAMSEIKERCLVNNRDAYANQRKYQKGQVFDMHSFAHILDHLNSNETEEKENEEVLKFVNEYEYIRSLELHYMGLSYATLKGKFVYTKPAPRHGELISAACKRVERQQEFYEKVQKLVKEYAARKKLNLKPKKIPTSIVPDKSKFETTTPEPVDLVFTRGIAGKLSKDDKNKPEVASKSKETENQKSKKKSFVPGPLLSKKQEAEHQKSKPSSVVTGPLTSKKQTSDGHKTSSLSAAETK